jgi:ABC-2 type transport system ATP-binding protein
MTALITARDLGKRYGSFAALDHVNFSIEPGRIVGLIGPNGAGKTTALRAILGLTSFTGELAVFGRNPFAARSQIMQDTCFIADVAVLPGWLRVGQALDFVGGVHPRFRRERAMSLLSKTQIKLGSRIRELSKGMKTQVHLALAMAIDAKLLVLDEPTLGLDLLARRAFYDALVNDYMDETRTILITTHQVEEIENLLTHVMFIEKGKIVLDTPVEAIESRFVAISVHPDKIAAAQAMNPFYTRPLMGKTIMYFEQGMSPALQQLGESHTPTIADLFVAKLSPAASGQGAA